MHAGNDPFSQMWAMPMNMFVGMMRGMQRMADTGMSTWSGGWSSSCPSPSWNAPSWGEEKRAMSETVCCASQSSAETQIACKDEWPGLEPCDQANQCCERDRLYRYTIVTVQRGKAEVLDFGEKLDTDCRSKCAFENWVLAAFVKEHCQKLTEEQIKYLRVYCEELDCWTKPPLEYEEKQLAILDGIRESLDRGRK